MPGFFCFQNTVLSELSNVMTNFGPTASLDAIGQRAALLKKIRDYFFVHNITEVEVPVLAEHSVTDVHLAALEVGVLGEKKYLQTSPEYYLKRLRAMCVQ